MKGTFYILNCTLEIFLLPSPVIKKNARRSFPSRHNFPFKLRDSLCIGFQLLISFIVQKNELCKSRFNLANKSELSRQYQVNTEIGFYFNLRLPTEFSYLSRLKWSLFGVSKSTRLSYF